MVQITSVLLLACFLAPTGAIPTGWSEVRSLVNRGGNMQIFPRNLGPRYFAIAEPEPTREGLERRYFAIAEPEPTREGLERRYFAIAEPEPKVEDM
ncbi:hypothetical protein FB451DRAFT_1406833 [Mycena latifolia]|nr:hypothetical protein FB451DRAFT_1406833 [Mycena latifolia]